MAKLMLFRKTEDKIPKLSKARVAEIQKYLSNPKKVRVQRPALTDLILSGKINNLGVVPQNQIFGEYSQGFADKGWEIPASDLGRKGTVDFSTTQSIKIWIETHFGDIVKPGSVTVLIVED